MGSKNKPGQYDCHEVENPDEPLFTLRGQDPLASDLVYLWKALREQRFEAAISHFAKLCRTARSRPVETREDKLKEAAACAYDMVYWPKKPILAPLEIK